MGLIINSIKTCFFVLLRRENITIPHYQIRNLKIWNQPFITEIHKDYKEKNKFEVNELLYVGDIIGFNKSLIVPIKKREIQNIVFQMN